MSLRGFFFPSDRAHEILYSDTPLEHPPRRVRGQSEDNYQVSPPRPEEHVATGHSVRLSEPPDPSRVFGHVDEVLVAGPSPDTLEIPAAAFGQLVAKLDALMRAQNRCESRLIRVADGQLAAQRTLEELASKAALGKKAQVEETPSAMTHTASQAGDMRAAISLHRFGSIGSVSGGSGSPQQRARRTVVTVTASGALSCLPPPLTLRPWVEATEAPLAASSLELLPHGLGGAADGTASVSVPAELQGRSPSAQRWSCMLHPHSHGRMAHDIFSIVFLVLDVFLIPVMLAWELPMKGSLRSIVLGSWMFWLLDFALNFCTGIIMKNGDITMNRRAVVTRYLTTWFTLDTLVLVFDFISILAAYQLEGVSSNKGTRLLRMAKFGRFLRIARLMRLLRVSTIFTRITDAFAGPTTDLLVDTITPLVLIVVINHMLACLWFGLGIQGPTDTGRRWVDEHVTEDSTYLSTNYYYQYSTALHWAMTQMTPGSMQVFPTNSGERTANCLCLLVGMITFSSIISMLSAKFVQKQAQQRDRAAKVGMLRRFLRRKMIQPRFAVLVERVALTVLSKEHSRPVVMDDIPAIKQLPSTIRSKLKMELSVRHLTSPLQRLWQLVEPHCLPALVSEAITAKSLAVHDTLFLPREEAKMCFVFHAGRMTYTVSEEQTDLKVGCTLAECALFLDWRFVGETLAQSGCEFLEINATQFGKVVQQSTLFQMFILEYSLVCLDVQNVLREQSRLSELELPETSMAGILPLLSLDARLISSAAAEKHAGRAAASRLFSDAPGLSGKILAEARNGHCTLMVNSSGEVERIVQIQVLKVQDKGKVLVELGKVSVDGTVVVDVRLPGKKHLGGESAAECLDRVLRDVLLPLAGDIEIEEKTVEESAAFSKAAKISSRYLRFVNVARVKDGAALDLLPVTFEQIPVGVRRASSIMPRRTSTVSTTQSLGHFHSRSLQKGRFSVDPGGVAVNWEALLASCSLLCDPQGDLRLHAFVGEEEFELLKGPAGEELQAMLEGRRLPPSLGTKALHRYKRALAVLEQRPEEPSAQELEESDGKLDTASMTSGDIF